MPPVTIDDGQTTAIVNWSEPNVTDNSGVFTLTSTLNSGSEFNIGTTDVTYIAVDSSGNKAEKTFVITVKGKFVLDKELECHYKLRVGGRLWTQFPKFPRWTRKKRKLDTLTE